MELHYLHEFHRPEATQRKAQLKRFLESTFRHAWKFKRDPHARALNFRYRMVTLDSTAGFDHCSYFSGPNGTLIIVTQPYDDPIPELREGLDRANLTADLIPAPEWAFYYPGRATLVILRFSPSQVALNSATGFPAR